MDGPLYYSWRAASLAACLAGQGWRVGIVGMGECGVVCVCVCGGAEVGPPGCAMAMGRWRWVDEWRTSHPTACCGMRTCARGYHGFVTSRRILYSYRRQAQRQRAMGRPSADVDRAGKRAGAIGWAGT